MPAPTRTRVIGVKVASGTKGEYVIVRNFDTGAKLTGPLSSALEAVFNAPITNWRKGDKIQFEMRGRVQGVKSATIQTGGVQHTTLSVAADTTTPGVSL